MPPPEGEENYENGYTHPVPLNQVENHYQPQPQPIAAATPRIRRPRSNSRGGGNRTNFSFSFTKSSTLSPEESTSRPDLLHASSSMSNLGGGHDDDVETGEAASPVTPGGGTGTLARRFNFRGGSSNSSFIRRASAEDKHHPLSSSHRRNSTNSVDSNNISEASSNNSFGSAASGGERAHPFKLHHNHNPPRNNKSNRRSTFMRLSPLFATHTLSSTNEDETDGGEFISGTATAVTSNIYSNNGRAAIRKNHRMTAYRRIEYNVGNYVLISNHNCEENTINLVNRYGFPEWGGRATTSEERRGPYFYLLTQVMSVHFGEDARYYTVRREDTMEDQRADAQYMEPITDPVGIEAAKLAARKRETCENGISGSAAMGEGSLKWLRPCTDALSNGMKQFREWGKRLIQKIKVQMGSCLNGNRPYGISIRLTGVNFFVICSIWYLYIDQLRLAFMPHSADYGCAVVSALVWIVLFLELVMEVFIRPNGYRALIRSDKAYLPSTVRYLNNFHLFSEMISLIFFIPEFMCLFGSRSCGDRYAFSLANACLMSLYGPDRLHAFYGTAFICIMRLRIFGLVRHWTNMWLNNTFVKVRGKNGEWRVQRGKGLFVPQGHWGGRAMHESAAIAMEESIIHQTTALATVKSSRNDGSSPHAIEEKKNEYTDDYHLTNASKIGTALFTTNAQRGLLFVFLIGLFPLIIVSFMTHGGTNQQLSNSVELLQSNNIVLNETDSETCAQLEVTLTDWIKSNAFEFTIDGTEYFHILSLAVEPVRCDFQKIDGGEGDGVLAAIMCRNDAAMDFCNSFHPALPGSCEQLCLGWAKASEEDSLDYLEKYSGVRPSVTVSVPSEDIEGTYSLPSGEIVSANFSVRVLYNEALSVRRTIITLFALQLGMTLFVLLGLSVLRYDAGRLVLGPLRRMLKIVAFYAKNPLSPPPQREGIESSERSSFQKQNEAYLYDSDDETTDKQLGTFETEQLINAVTKITDLLRKCWGVAGAGIISSNLARQEGGLTAYFNPTVPGKAVYALFAFVVIDKFQSHLHALKGDIMILINDIAAVLHEEVYRWGYDDSGQCNKNLGSAFLMVYRIGAVCEVVEKREKAEAVIFSRKDTSKVRRRKSRRAGFQDLKRSSLGGSRRGSVQFDADRFSRSHVDNLDLSSLPGMRTFTDRALLGLLKTFASIHRDSTIKNWNDDFRLGAGVGAVSINLNFGMDAGWAVEGAVGSSYKIDATYLSPHVNMASRMMSATKQYGLFFLLSQAVQRLLSENAQEKLRHIDTVTVKGSSVQQKIFTYDAKVRQDFFLYSRTETQADLDSERYSPAIWNVDQDLVAMRNHISSEFMDMFNRGRDEYLAGNWPAAIRLLKSADKIMFEREVDEGYSNKSYSENLKSLTNLDDYDEAEERLSMGDGPCQRLISYMEEMGGEAPDDWRGYRPLTSK